MMFGSHVNNWPDAFMFLVAVVGLLAYTARRDRRKNGD